MTVCRNKGINRIYIPIWVAFTEAKYSPALRGNCSLSFYPFPGSCRNIFRPWTGSFLVLCFSGWTEWHVQTEGLKRELCSQKKSNVVTCNTTILASRWHMSWKETQQDRSAFFIYIYNFHTITFFKKQIDVFTV